MRPMFRYAMGLGALAFAVAAHGQSPSTSTGAQPAPVRQVPFHEAQPGARVGPEGVIRQWGPSQPIVQNVPAPAQEYPKCGPQIQDSCTNAHPDRALDDYPADRGQNRSADRAAQQGWNRPG